MTKYVKLNAELKCWNCDSHRF